MIGQVQNPGPKTVIFRAAASWDGGRLSISRESGLSGRFEINKGTYKGRVATRP